MENETEITAVHEFSEQVKHSELDITVGNTRFSICYWSPAPKDNHPINFYTVFAELNDQKNWFPVETEYLLKRLNLLKDIDDNTGSTTFLQREFHGRIWSIIFDSPAVNERCVELAYDLQRKLEGKLGHGRSQNEWEIISVEDFNHFVKRLTEFMEENKKYD